MARFRCTVYTGGVTKTIGSSVVYVESVAVTRLRCTVYRGGVLVTLGSGVL